MDIIVTFLHVFIRIMIAAIFIRALLSWFVRDPRNALVIVLDQITEPIIEPLRRVVPRLGMIDITPMVAIIILIAVDSLLTSY